MKNRCLNSNDSRWKDYGGRGIGVATTWVDSFKQFYDDMGPRPTSKHTLDRVDVNGPYCKDNCRWATQTQQNRNRRNNKMTMIKADEVRLLCRTKSQSEVARMYKISQALVWNIINELAWV